MFLLKCKGENVYQVGKVCFVMINAVIKNVAWYFEKVKYSIKGVV